MTEPGGPTLEERLNRLDEIAEAMEADALELDASLALFEEAVGHLRAVQESLDRARLRVDELVGSGDAAELRPLQEEGQ